MVKIRKLLMILVLFLGALFVFWSFFTLVYAPMFTNQEEAKLLVLNNQLSDIQIELEKYADSTNGTFPQSISDLNIQLPINPFNKQESMRNIFLGNPKLIQGAFTYMPLKVNNEIRGYFLLGYREYVEQPDWKQIIESAKNNDPLDDYIVLIRSPRNFKFSNAELEESISQSLRSQSTPIKYQSDIQSFLILNSQ